MIERAFHRPGCDQPSWAAVLVLVAAAVLIPAPAPIAGASEAGEVAIIAHRDVPVDNLPFSEVRKIFLGDRQFWSAGLKVNLLVRAPVAREREVVLNTIYQMSEAQFRQYWIAKVFRAEVAGSPKVFYSNDMGAELVTLIPGAIAFVDAANIPTGVKVLRIDGRLPGEKGYRLR